MPISNESQLWPKILICKKCHTPVEAGEYKQTDISSYYYTCPHCDGLVSSQSVEWKKIAS